MRLQRKHFWHLTAASALMLGVAGITVPSFMHAEEVTKPEATTFAKTHIGEMTGAPESARIAIVAEGDKFIAYVCSADQEFNDAFSRWFKGEIKAGKLSAKTADGTEVTATVNGESIEGKVSRDGKTHDFKAKAIAPDADAGLFRAGETFGADDYVIGWIIDEKDHIVGTGGRQAPGAKVQTQQRPQGNNNLNPVVGGKPLQPGKVSGVGNPVAKKDAAGGIEGKKEAPPVAGQGRKLDAAAKNEMLQDLTADRQASGGNVIQAMLIHQIRRFNSGKKPETNLEQKTFAILQKANGKSLTDYMKNWEGLPKATRDAILGPAASQLDGNKGLAVEQVKALAGAMPQVRALRTARAAAPATGTVKGVSIPTVKCIDETNPERIGSDEIFAIHTVVVGNGDPVIKRTSVLTEFDDGVQKNFSAADATVFPLTGLTPTEGAEVFIITTLYEDDGSGVAAVLNFLKPLIEVAVTAIIDSFRDKDNKLTPFEKALVKLAVDAAIAGVTGPLSNLLVQPLGTDSIVVKPDGSVTSENGGNKTKMSFRKVKNGEVRYDYELKGFTVQK